MVFIIPVNTISVCLLRKMCHLSYPKSIAVVQGLLLVGQNGPQAIMGNGVQDVTIDAIGCHGGGQSIIYRLFGRLDRASKEFIEGRDTVV
jgi:hypothetical protein